MTEEKKDYYILTDSKEKFEELENAYKKFRENYIINLSKGYTGRLIVKEDSSVKDKITIYPEEYGEIEEIIIKESNLEGRTLRNGQGGPREIQLGKYVYIIYNNNDIPL